MYRIPKLTFSFWLLLILDKGIIEEETNSEITNTEVQTNDVDVVNEVVNKLVDSPLKSEDKMRVKCAQISIEVWPEKNMEKGFV